MAFPCSCDRGFSIVSLESPSSYFIRVLPSKLESGLLHVLMAIHSWGEDQDTWTMSCRVEVEHLCQVRGKPSLLWGVQVGVAPLTPHELFTQLEILRGFKTFNSGLFIYFPFFQLPLQSHCCRVCLSQPRQPLPPSGGNCSSSLIILPRPTARCPLTSISLPRR